MKDQATVPQVLERRAPTLSDRAIAQQRQVAMDTRPPIPVDSCAEGDSWDSSLRSSATGSPK
jgi:hypothetical protein